MKTKLYVLLTFCFAMFNGQVLLTSNPSLKTTPDPSSVLDISDNNKGVLFPQVALTGVTDKVTVPTPVDALLLYNTNTQRYNYWNETAQKWYKNFDVQDGVDVIELTNNFTSSSTSKTEISSFPSTMPLYALESGTTGWTNLNVNTTINITKANNTNYILAEGMAQLDNTNNSDREFQFAIGVFVDGKLKIVRKFYKFGSATCIWKKFSVSGVFNNLSVGSHTIQIYAANLPKVGATTGYTNITYGGNNVGGSGCTNINDDMAKIFVTAQVTQ